MTPQIAVSLATAVLSLVVSIVTVLLTQRMKQANDMRVEELKDQLSAMRSEKDARRDYEYEARKRVYEQFGPLQFQMVELCEYSYARAALMSGTTRSGQPPLRYDSGWQKDPHAMLATIYELMAPLVLFRIARTRLTLVDLSLDPDVREQYQLYKALYEVWTNGSEVARTEPELSYSGHYWENREVPLPRQLDQLLDAMIRKDPIRDQPACVDFGVFSDDCLAGRLVSVENMVQPLLDFDPSAKPVLWRTLIINAHICRAIMSRGDGSGKRAHPADAITEQDLSVFAGVPGTGSAGQVDEPILAAQRYLRAHIR